jgi:hypothetical protein
MQDLFDSRGQRIPSPEAAAAASNEKNHFPADVMHLQSHTFSSNLTIPSSSLFQLVKNKEEAMTLLSIRHNAEKLDIFTSQLVMELQQREVCSRELLQSKIQGPSWF